MVERASEYVADSIESAVAYRQGLCSVKLEMDKESLDILKKVFVDKGYQVDYDNEKKQFTVIWEKKR